VGGGDRGTRRLPEGLALFLTGWGCALDQTKALIELLGRGATGRVPIINNKVGGIKVQWKSWDIASRRGYVCEEVKDV
jgi:hypothetical protein